MHHQLSKFSAVTSIGSHLPGDDDATGYETLDSRYDDETISIELGDLTLPKLE